MGNLIDPDFVVVRKNQSMLEVLTALRRCGAMLGIVTEPNQTWAGKVIGVITKDKVADAVAESVQVYPR